MPDVGREEDTGDVRAVCCELAHRYYRCCVVALDHAPDVDVSLGIVSARPCYPVAECFSRKGQTHSIIPSANHASVRGYCDGSNAHIVLGYQLVTALVLAQIPDPDIAAAVTADQLALVRMNDNVIHRHPMCIVALHITAARIPDLDRAVFRGRDEPLGLAVEGDAGDVGCVAVEGEDGIRIGTLNVVQLDGVVAGGG